MSLGAGAPRADEAIRAGSKSFALASRLFDDRTRHLVWDLYAWCRHCDDAVDGQLLGHGTAVVTTPPAALEHIVAGTERALNGPFEGPGPFAGLSRVVAETGIPHHYVRAHLAGFAMDAAGNGYDTLDDTLEYCYHVAGVVGRMMAWIMGVRDEATLLRGCDLGLAFQMTNIARDVGDDAEAGRVYLPSAWLREAGVQITPGRRLDTQTARAVAPVVARLLDEADRYYGSARYGISRLPWRSAWAVETARHVYADIGVLVRQRGPSAWDSRAIVGRRRKLLRLVQALGQSSVVKMWERGDVPARAGLWSPPSGMATGHATLRK